MADERRYCAHCDQSVVKIPEPKAEWTTRSGEQGQFKHTSSGENGIPNCRRQFLAESETYTEQ